MLHQGSAFLFCLSFSRSSSNCSLAVLGRSPFATSKRPSRYANEDSAGRGDYKLSGRVSLLGLLGGEVVEAVAHYTPQRDGCGPNGICHLVGQYLRFPLAGMAVGT